MRYLITGGSGFLGQATVRAALEDGASVRVLARNAKEARSKLPDEVSIHEGDVCDRPSVDAAIREVDAVVHLASDFRNLKDDEGRSWRVNVQGSINVLESADSHGVSRVVHCSTIGVHGSLQALPGDEESPIRPSDLAYERHKAEAERAAFDFHERSGIDVVVVRPGGIYGPGDSRLLKLFRMVQRRRFFLVGSGETHMDLVHVDDVARGLILAANHPDAPGQAFIMSGGDPRSVRDTVGLIADAVGTPPPKLRLPMAPFYWGAVLAEKVFPRLGIDPPLTRRRLGFFTNDRAFSIEKARSLLGYEVAHPLAEGLAETAEWYRSQGLLSS